MFNGLGLDNSTRLLGPSPDIVDTFSRTSALAASSTETGGKTWAGAGWTTDGTAAKGTSTNSACTIDCGSRPKKITYKVKVVGDSTNTQSLMLLWDHTDNGNQGRFQISVEADGTLSTVLAYFKTGAAQSPQAQDVPATIDYETDYEPVTIEFFDTYVVAYFDNDRAGTQLTYDTDDSTDWVTANNIGFRNDVSTPVNTELCSELRIWL